MATNIEFVNSVYRNMLLRDADNAGLGYYANRLEQGLATRAQVVESILFSDEINALPHTLANAYLAVLGRFPDKAGLSFWKDILNSGATIEQVTQQLLDSSEFKTRNGILTDSDKVKLFYQNALGRQPDADGLAYWVGLLAKGAKPGEVAASIALSQEGKTRNEATINKLLAWHAVVGDEPTSTELTNLPSDKSELAVSVVKVSPAIQGPGTFWEAGLTLYGSGNAITGAVVIDLDKNTLSMAGANQTLASGNMSLVLNVDMSSLALAEGAKIDEKATPQVVSFIGDSLGNTFIGGDLGNKFTGAKGNDSYTLGSGIDVVVFAKSDVDNGVDTINNFTLGAKGDVLNFSAFLNKTGVTKIATQVAGSTAALAWTNGDVLVAQGYSIDTPEEVMALFSVPTIGAVVGVNSAFAAPAAQAKAVVITSDVVGNAMIWYVTNQVSGNIQTIEASEIKHVGTLTDVNNLVLVGFNADNFA